MVVRKHGSRAFFEGASTNAVGLKDWEQETIRAECELGTLVLNARRLERFPYDATKQRASTVEGEGEEIPLLDRSKWKNAWLIEQFVQLAMTAERRWRPILKTISSRPL